MRILPIDELNGLEAKLTPYFNEQGHIKSDDACEDIIDELLDLYLLALANGVNSVNEQFNTDIQPTDDDVYEIIYYQIDGMTFEDRVRAWYEADGTIEDIVRIAETESHRIGNTAAFNTAVKAGATQKTWLTMLDDRVREEHQYLESVSVPIDSEFYTFDGDHAPAPGMFQNVANNANCRCELAFS